MDHCPSPHSTERSHSQAEGGRWDSQGTLCHTAGFPLHSHCRAAGSSAGHCEVHVKKEAPREVRAALEKQQGAAKWWQGSRDGRRRAPLPFPPDPSIPSFENLSIQGGGSPRPTRKSRTPDISSLPFYLPPHPHPPPSLLPLWPYRYPGAFLSSLLRKALPCMEQLTRKASDTQNTCKLNSSYL